MLRRRRPAPPPSTRRSDAQALAEPATSGLLEASRVRPFRRLLTLALVVGTLIAVGLASGLASELTAENVRVAVGNAGALGMLVYLAIFIAGQLLHLPGLIFIGGGAIAWGAGLGGAAALVAGTVAVSVNFLFVRTVGGQPMGELKNRYARWVLDLVERRPLTAVLLVRSIFFTSPAMTAALALSPVRFRDHLVGSLVGMAPAVLLSAWFIDRLL